MARTTRWWTAAAIATLVITACGGEQENASAAPTDPAPALPMASAVDPAEPTSSSPAGSPTTPTPTAPTPTGSAATPADPGALPIGDDRAPRAPIEPGEPEVLLSGLYYPARLAIDETSLYVANRTGYREASDGLGTVVMIDDGAPPEPAAAPLLDEMLVVPRNAPSSEPRVLFSFEDMNGFDLAGDTLWVASLDQGLFAAFDRTTGAELDRVDPLGNHYPYQVALNDEWVFLASSVDLDGAAVELVSRVSGSTDSLFIEGAIGAPRWMAANETTLYLASYDAREHTARVFAIDLQSRDARLLNEAQTSIGAIALYAGDLLYDDWDNGALMRLATDGATAPTAVASVFEPWGLVVDGDYAYVSTQPEGCANGPEGSIVRVSLLDGSTLTLTENVSCPSMLIAASEALYWVNNGEVDKSSSRTVSLGTGSVARLPR